MSRQRNSGWALALGALALVACSEEAEATGGSLSAQREAPLSPRERPADWRDLELGEARVHVPEALVDLEEERLERLRQAPRRQDPFATVEVVGVRGANMMFGTVTLMRVRHARDRPSGMNVRRALEASIDSDRQYASRQGVEAEIAVEAGPQWIKSRFRKVVRQNGVTASVEAHSYHWVGVDGYLHSLTAQCMGLPEHADALCARVLGSFELARSPEALPLDASIP